MCHQLNNGFNWVGHDSVFEICGSLKEGVQTTWQDGARLADGKFIYFSGQITSLSQHTGNMTGWKPIPRNRRLISWALLPRSTLLTVPAVRTTKSETYFVGVATATSAQT
jgi:hypothetical protein